MNAGLVIPPGRQGPGAVSPNVVEALDLAFARRAAGLLAGDKIAVGAGDGTELQTLRPYEVGDDVRRLDAAASARTGVPHVRLHVPERVLTTWLLVDCSPAMAFGSADRLKSDVAEGVASVVGRLAVRRGGRLGVVTFGAPGRLSLPPRGGRTAAVAAQRLVARGVAPDGHDDPDGLARALTRVGRTARQRGLVVIVSDFRADRGFARALRAVAARHGVVGVEITDPRELALPAVGPLALVDPQTGRRLDVDSDRTALRERFAALARERRERLTDELRRAGAGHVVLSTEGDWLRELGRRFS